MTTIRGKDADVSIDLERGKVQVFRVPKDKFIEIKRKAVHYDSATNDKGELTEWVMYGGVTFFKE